MSLPYSSCASQRPRLRRALGSALITLVVAGCAGQPADGPGSKAPSRRAADATATSPGVTASSEATAALVEVETDVGFTVTEVVEISSRVRAMHTEALALLADEEFPDGIALMQEVVAAVPDATGPLVDLGIAYSRSGSFKEAEDQFLRALALTPNHPVAHNELGVAHRKMGRFDAARQSYEQALAIYPGFHYARRNLAVLCDLYLADLNCALEHYGVYQAAVPDDREVAIWVGDLELRIAAASRQEVVQ